MVIFWCLICSCLLMPCYINRWSHWWFDTRTNWGIWSALEDLGFFYDCVGQKAFLNEIFIQIGLFTSKNRTRTIFKDSNTQSNATKLREYLNPNWTLSVKKFQYKFTIKPKVDSQSRSNVFVSGSGDELCWWQIPFHFEKTITIYHEKTTDASLKRYFFVVKLSDFHCLSCRVFLGASSSKWLPLNEFINPRSHNVWIIMSKDLKFECEH